MDLYMIVLRILHIFAGVIWVGSGLFLTFILIPTIERAGETGSGFMQKLSQRASRMGIMFAASSLITTVAGLLLYERVSGRLDSDWLQSTQGVVLTIGAIAGILAFGHGGGALGPSTDRIGELANEIEAGGGTATPEQMTQFHALYAKLTTHMWISVGLMVIAVAGMSTFRYF